jgi:hypothetical protein
LAVVAALCLALLAGCATRGDTQLLIQRDLAQRQPDQAVAQLQKSRVPSTDRALYLLNQGMLLHLGGKWQASNDSFEEAQRLMEQLAALSLREQGSSLLVNDYTRSYEGEPYDKVMLHVYKALNYLALHQPYEARVEALQLDQEFRSLEEDAGRHDPELGFPRYLAGMIYESLGEWSDAMIAYRKAYDAYRRHAQDYGVAVPDDLKLDLLRMTRREGLNKELAQYQKDFGLPPPPDAPPPGSPGSKEGEVVLVFNAGLAPYKGEHSVTVPYPSTGQLIRISLPYMIRRIPQAAAARIEAGGRAAATQKVEDIGAVAAADLDARMPGITARSVARIIAKKKVEDRAARDSPLAGVLLNVAAVLTEVADTRSWSTLPNDIQVARLPLPPGRYDVRVDVLDRGGRVIGEQAFPDVAVRAEAKTFISYYWSPSTLPGARP